MASLQLHIAICLILPLIANAQTFLGIANSIPPHNLLQSSHLSKFNLFGTPLHAIQSDEKREKLYGLPPLPVISDFTEKNVITGKFGEAKAAVSLPELTTQKPINNVNVPLNVPNLSLFPPFGLLQFGSTEMHPERPPQHESKYVGLFAPDGSFLGDPVGLTPAKPKISQGSNYYANDKQMYDKSSFDSYSDQMESKNTENVKPNVILEDIAINDDDPVLDKVNVTYNDETARKRFTKYAHNEDDSDLLQKSDESELDKEPLIKSLKTESQQQQQLSQKPFTTTHTISSASGTKIHHGTAQQRLDTTSIRKVYTPYDVVPSAKTYSGRLTKDLPALYSPIISRNGEEKHVNSMVGQSLINDRLNYGNHLLSRAYDKVITLPRSVNSFQQQVLQSNNPSKVSLKIEEQDNTLPVPALPRSSEDNMYLKEVEDYDHILEASGRNFGFLAPNHVPPQLQVFIPTTTAAPLFLNYQRNLFQQTYSPTVFPQNPPFQHVNPGYITPTPFQPMNIFTPSPEIKRLFNIGNSYSIRPWQFSPNVQQFPSIFPVQSTYNSPS